jgi:MFS transporter, DHA1 family, multidrug resistance protein
MSPGLVVLMLALLLGTQPLATDLYLPALPGITSGFAAPVSQAQLTLTAMLLAFGVSQLAWGPLSDRFGRRPVLLFGLALFTLASAGCALAPSMAALVSWRTVQGVALGAAVMCARAIVRDLFTPAAGTFAMSRALSGLGLIACTCGPLGGVFTQYLGWRWALGWIAVVGAGTLALVALRFQETLPLHRRAPLDVRTIAANCAVILRHPTFLANSALATASYAGLFTFLAASSFVFLQVIGLTRTQYGLLMASTAVLYISGTFVCRQLLPRLGLRRTVAVAGGIALAAGTLMGGLALAGVHTTWALLLPFWLYMLGHGISQSCGQSGSVAPFPKAAGAASALNGFLMMLAAFAVGAWVGRRLDGTVFALTQGVWFWSACVAGVAWTVMQRHGEHQPR